MHRQWTIMAATKMHAALAFVCNVLVIVFNFVIMLLALVALVVLADQGVLQSIKWKYVKIYRRSYSWTMNVHVVVAYILCLYLLC